MSRLDKLKISYEYNETYPEIKKAIKDMMKIKPHDKVKIKKLRGEGFTATELAIMYDVSVQKIAAITRKVKPNV